MMYVLQANINPEHSVVLGVYDNFQLMKKEALRLQEENPKWYFFYDLKQVNNSAKWTNEQQAIWL